jgi:hypothetical protein
MLRDPLGLEVLAMKCPKCGYTSFPYLESCRKCGQGLTEQRTALGIYALRPDPLDLLLAYQAAKMDVARATLPQPLSAPDSDLGQRDDVELEIAEVEPAGPALHEVGEQAGAAVDVGPTLELESIEDGKFPPVEPSTDPVGSQDTLMPPTLDLSELGDITLEIEHAADLGGKSPETTEIPSESPQLKPVYDLDLDEDLGGVTLGFSVDESPADGDGEEAAEYTLEIEDDLELEVEELEFEEDGEAGEGDDDDR